MSRQAYVNGRFLPHGQAVVHIEDRGFQFADGVYEVWSAFDGRLADYRGHMDRLERSLDALQIERPMSRAALTAVLRETLRRNRVRDGVVYLQITRGTARRDHPFPDPPVAPSVVVTARAVDLAAGERRARTGVAVVTAPDIRWGRCDIKSVALLPNVLAKQAAKAAGAAETWMVDELGFITEGASTNAWIIDRDGALRTRDTNANILRGVTRGGLIGLARAAGIEVAERPFTVEDVKTAREAFFSAASAFVTPVVTIDGVKIGDGQPGPTTTRLRALYLARARETAV
jgi:D-alanine transaminase